MATKDYSQLTEETTVQDTDLLATFRSTGPLKRLTALIFKTYAQLGALLVNGSVPMTGGLAVFYGTEGSPGVTFNGDNDTGFYRVEANGLGISAGGVKRLEISSTAMTPTVPIYLAAGTTSISPLNFTAGTNLTTPAVGAVEFDGSLIYVTITGPTRKTLAFTDSNITGSAAKWTTARTLSFTGNVTGSGSVDGSDNVATALTIAAGAVTNDMLANVSTATFKGRTTAGTGAPEDLSVAQATALLAVTSGAGFGLLNADKTDSGNNTYSGTAKFTGIISGGSPTTVAPSAGVLTITTSNVVIDGSGSPTINTIALSGATGGMRIYFRVVNGTISLSRPSTAAANTVYNGGGTALSVKSASTFMLEYVYPYWSLREYADNG